MTLITTVAKEAMRIDAGKELLALQTQAVNALNQLKNVKLNAEALKTRFETETDIFTAADVTEIQTAIDTTIAEAETIFQGIKAS